jgi:hypothetical protein
MKLTHRLTLRSDPHTEGNATQLLILQGFAARYHENVKSITLCQRE